MKPWEPENNERGITENMQRTMKISDFNRDMKTALGQLADNGIPIELERRGRAVATITGTRAITNYRNELIRRARTTARTHRHDVQRVEDALDVLLWFTIYIEPIHDHTGQPLNEQDVYDRIRRSIVDGIAWGNLVDRIERDIRADIEQRLGGPVTFRLDEATMRTNAANTVESFGLSWDDATIWGLSLDEASQVAALWDVTIKTPI